MFLSFFFLTQFYFVWLDAGFSQILEISLEYLHWPTRFYVQKSVFDTGKNYFWMGTVSPNEPSLPCLFCFLFPPIVSSSNPCFV